MKWAELPVVLNDWTAKIAATSFDIRKEAASTILTYPTGYYVNPVTDQIGVFAKKATDADLVRAKLAVHRATGVTPLFLSYQDLSNPEGSWVKVAYSQSLRDLGENLNFFPGQYVGGIPNNPSPVAAMLTSGLLGAGIGYGSGRLLGSILPQGYGKKLGRTGAILGGAIGAVPGLTWGVANQLSGAPFNDPSLLSKSPDADPEQYQNAINGTNWLPNRGADSFSGSQLEQARDVIVNSPLFHKMSEDLSHLTLGKMYSKAVEKLASSFGQRPPASSYIPTDVNIDHLGRTLWDVGASPALAATTMAGMYAAQQLPDPRSRPGWVTGNQLGQLAENAVGDYAKGWMVGKAINATIGTPYSAPVFGLGNSALGVIGAVVPKLFGG